MSETALFIDLFECGKFSHLCANRLISDKNIILIQAPGPAMSATDGDMSAVSPIPAYIQEIIYSFPTAHYYT